MTTLHNTHCCSVEEIDNLSHSKTPQDALKAIKPQLEYTLDIPNMITFTGVIKRKVEDHASNRRDNYGAAFAHYIKENELGTVDCGIKAVVNHRTGNTVKLWVWYPNRRALLSHFNKLG